MQHTNGDEDWHSLEVEELGRWPRQRGRSAGEGCTREMGGIRKRWRSAERKPRDTAPDKLERPIEKLPDTFLTLNS